MTNASGHGGLQGRRVGSMVNGPGVGGFPGPAGEAGDNGVDAGRGGCQGVRRQRALEHGAAGEKGGVGTGSDQGGDVVPLGAQSLRGRPANGAGAAQEKDGKWAHTVSLA